MDKLPIVRTSERSAVGRCPQKWWWGYREGLVPFGEQPDALWFGIGVHEALAKWYKLGFKRGTHPATTFEKWVDGEIREIRASSEEWEEAKWEDAAELGVAMLENYVDKYGKDDSWYVLATEHPFRVKVFRNGKPVAYFVSRWDGVYRDMDDGGRIKLMEHKTASQIMTAYLELDDQAGAYVAVAEPVCHAKGWLKPDEHITEITYNFLRKSKGEDDRPENAAGQKLNKDGTVSKKQPAPLFVRHPVERDVEEHHSQMMRLTDQVTVMNAMRDGTIPVVKRTQRDCTYCEYFDMCKLHERGKQSWKDLRDSLYYVRDPYADNRKSASE